MVFSAVEQNFLWTGLDQFSLQNEHMSCEKAIDFTSTKYSFYTLLHQADVVKPVKSRHCFSSPDTRKGTVHIPILTTSYSTEHKGEMRTSETSVAAWWYHDQMTVRIEITRRHSNESAAWGKFTEGELLLGIPSLLLWRAGVSLALLWSPALGPFWGGEHEAVRTVAAVSHKCRPDPFITAAVPGQSARGRFVGSAACTGLCWALVHVTGSSPAFIPQNKQPSYNVACSIKIKCWFFQFLGSTRLHLFSLSVGVTLKKVSWSTLTAQLVSGWL